MYINHDPVMTMTYFTARSTWVAYAFELGKLVKWHLIGNTGQPHYNAVVGVHKSRPRVIVIGGKGATDRSSTDVYNTLTGVGFVCLKRFLDKIMFLAHLRR